MGYRIAHEHSGFAFFPILPATKRSASKPRRAAAKLKAAIAAFEPFKLLKRHSFSATPIVPQIILPFAHATFLSGFLRLFGPSRSGHPMRSDQ
jgi:hypothetical protein